MEDINIKPSIIKTIYDIEKELKSTGLNDDDLLMLIQKRIRGRPAKSLIKSVLKGIKQLEWDLNLARFNKKGGEEH